MAQRVFVLTEATPEGMHVVGVFARYADAMRRLDELYVHECDERGLDPEDDPWCFTDQHGGTVGDTSQLEGWVYWKISSERVA